MATKRRKRKQMIFKSLEELDAFIKTPKGEEIWGDSNYTFYPSNGKLYPQGCGMCRWCEGEETKNCQNLTFLLEWME